MALPCMHRTLHVIEITSVLSAKQKQNLKKDSSRSPSRKLTVPPRTPPPWTLFSMASLNDNLILFFSDLVLIKSNNSLVYIKAFKVVLCRYSFLSLKAVRRIVEQRETKHIMVWICFLLRDLSKRAWGSRNMPSITLIYFIDCV